MKEILRFKSRFKFSQFKAAFTLAEVLIVLGIIGVVAAMTIPTLIEHTRKQETSTALKKFYSNMNQAIKLSEIDNGDPSNWEYIPGSTKAIDFFNMYLKDYLKVSKINISNSTIYLNDGTSLYLWTGNCVDMLFDVNGDKKPNSFGKDIFDFLFCSSPANSSYFKNNKKYFGTFYEGVTREYAMNYCKD